jgi:hypothetical protein
MAAATTPVDIERLFAAAVAGNVAELLDVEACFGRAILRTTDTDGFSLVV